MSEPTLPSSSRPPHRSGHMLRSVALLIALGGMLAVAVTARAGGERCAAAARAAAAQASPSVLTSAALGPPMVCHDVIIGSAKSLPWEGGRGGSDSKYDVGNLPEDTVDLLTAESSTIVRMETLRRAAVYLSYQDRAKASHLAWEIIGRRGGWVMFGEASGKRDPAAWFDVAYFLGCLNQVEVIDGFKLGEAEGVPGYLFMQKALKLAKEIDVSEADLAQMNFGAAVMTHPAMRHREYMYVPGTKDDIYDRHILAALKAAKGNDLLEINLAAHLKHFGGSIEDVRKVASAK